MNFYDDISYQKFQNYLPALETNTKIENESTTRLRVLDTILFDVLSWDKKLVETEKYCRSEGYADYVFTTNEKPCLVLEAKRAGIEFIIPDRKFEDRPYVCGLLAQECKASMDALQQAIGYATTLGARYVAISNGHQWLFTLTYVQGQPLKSRLIYVFESLQAISSRFSKFYLCFSMQGLEENIASQELLDTLKLPAPAKFSSYIPGYPHSATRNVLQNELAYILNYVWQVIEQKENSTEFVENCYVSPCSHDDILALARELIEKRRNEDGILGQYDIERIVNLPDKIAYLPAEKPFVILGEVGRGKSSFLNYLKIYHES